MRQRIGVLPLAISSLVLAGSAAAADWGDLSGTLVYDGKAPSPAPIVVTKDAAHCGKFNLVDEGLVVNPDNNGVANVIVFLYVGRGDKSPPVHASYEESAKAERTIDNKGCRFEPRVVALRTSQALVVSNSDPIGHNTNFTTFSNVAQNVLIPGGGKLNMSFPSEERLPVKVACNIHPWMTGWLVVKEHPYMAVTDADGKFEIKNVPAGEWTFQFWQEAAGYVDEVTVNGKKTKWDKGRPELTIKAGKNDLGTIQVAPSLFKN